METRECCSSNLMSDGNPGWFVEGLGTLAWMDGDVVFRTDPSDVFRVRLRELMHLSEDLLETGWRRDLENDQRLVSRVRDAMSDSRWNMNGDSRPCLDPVILKRDLSAA